ncbi:hypothetical protein [Kitasatospora sp. A2-31]|uniref:hypothetical protein n=1 Tax=Kitasatospora sp. A2-31 TaxID=2916414 RepID=UPI001EEE1FD8|nr:hypothetical protein [Kitasatospora sp. A2-31]MCG6498797.1 hypothetical protein [Kitasatospora sp. A2-31]MCG6500462.1 hypothetical protein [Kitasatospora sp. A2-31]
MTERPESNDTIPAEFDGLVGEFRDLLAKYPQAAGHFSLAYHPAGGDGPNLSTPKTAGFIQPVFECEKIDEGFIVCRRVDEQ